MKPIILLFLLTGLFSCTPEKNEQSQTPKEEPPYSLAKPKAEWVTQRVASAKQRLCQTAAGQLVWKSMEFHGGLERWWNNGPVNFRFNYQPKPGTGTARDTYEVADYWSSKTKHQSVSNPQEQYGFDGTDFWYAPATAEIPYNTRFWALTPYYFAGMPFVFGDEGVNLEQEEDIQYEDATHHVVRVAFGDNVGDAPDDYYVLYIHSETFRLAAIRYVVSYPAYFKDGGHSQEKLMTYEGQQTVGGIIFPEKHRTFMWEADGTIGDYVTDITLSDIEFLPETEQSYFDRPTGSKVMKDLAE
ncbi:MAG: hypothetical protein RIF33_16830 [Cyclobacteriaceae bacterium]